MNKPLSGTLAAAKMQGNDPGFSRIDPLTLNLIFRCAARARLIAEHHRLNIKHDKVLEVNQTLIAMDLSIVYLRRGYDVRKLLLCDDLTFISEYGLIQKFIERANNSFPASIKLKFAQSGAV